MNGYTRFKNLFPTTRSLFFLGAVFSVMGLVGVIEVFVDQHLYSRPADFGMGFANAAFLAAGAVAMMAAGRLKDLEQRLDRMEMRLNKDQ